MIKQKFHHYRQKICALLCKISNRLPARLRGVNGVVGLVVIILILIVIITSVIQSTKTPPIKGSSTITVELSTVKQQTIPVNIEALGSLTADQKIDVSPEVEGQIAKVEFKNGQEVKAGKVLFQLDDSVAQAQFAAAEAKLR
jgi:multidrug efflux pump subunit AcrA (membrane-fusion protein)